MAHPKYLVNEIDHGYGVSMKIALFAVAAAGLLVAACQPSGQNSSEGEPQVSNVHRCPTGREQAVMSDADIDTMINNGCEATCPSGSSKRLRRFHRRLDDQQLLRLREWGCRETSVMRNRLG